jgi:adenosylcobyric acid synthase
MALNSFVTPEGAEIGRAQAAQAAAARISPEAVMNPVLLKPSTQETQVIVRGRPRATASAMSYQGMKKDLLPIVLESLEDLRSRFDVVVCEGAGSPAEINLRESDIANMGLARAANLPVILVGDIDRGGLFASLYGTLALLSPEDQALVSSFLVNKFRGDPAVLAPGLEKLSQLTDRPFIGTLPFVSGLGIDGEDSLALDAPRAMKAPLGRDVLRVAVARLGRISNFTDFDPLAHEPGVRVRFTGSPGEILEADLAVLPGTKSTVADLEGLRSRGLDRAFCERARRGLPTLGICGGYQMLGGRILDGVESGEQGSACCPSRRSSGGRRCSPAPPDGLPASETRRSRDTRYTTAAFAGSAASGSSRQTARRAAASGQPWAPRGTGSWSPTASAAPSSPG